MGIFFRTMSHLIKVGMEADKRTPRIQGSSGIIYPCTS